MQKIKTPANSGSQAMAGLVGGQSVPLASNFFTWDRDVSPKSATC